MTVPLPYTSFLPADQLSGPYDMPTSGSVESEVVRKSTGQVLAASNIVMAPVSPALFVQGGFPQGALAALNRMGP
jgi:hypothetical protein